MTVNIRFDGDVTLDDSEAWPDGVPERPTAKAFALMMERDGSKGHTLSDYCLMPDSPLEDAVSEAQVSLFDDWDEEDFRCGDLCGT